ncbi:4-(cytidine 5'-diphospho)-2-C-methyl-D-erythritol kinase [Oxynema aestuarii]|uniref:4-diphosphocytidyl-2-C-methyl-D-erythritol kinase n=1 Tax=Oxynema aestuarii AP17 TaxID=2064643 RepID=A0A6H1U4W3_9CYAN|nr:4-(cytidine 5'-diphospho)-2-C-methyl-D-erythritol kinase [Oxynema aestuarii]QIZ73466.1 4-(cytidine 5'-diphospho)-2-C-methyl-D-erythritol kinase [Oxynema aestuarii AP17]
MRAYTLLAPAKINLYLEIIGDRPDGYHELAMVMQSIGLCDRVKVRPNGIEDFQIHCNHPQVPCDRTNLAYRAAELLKNEFPDSFAQYGAAEIEIDKQIPVAAGLAGGSSNAAAVLVGLNLLWQIGLTQPELQELGARLGADVPFCISGGTALATGRGDRLEPLPDLDDLWVVVGKYRTLAVSTPWAYKTYRQEFGDTYVSQPQDLARRQQRVHAGPMVAAISHRDGEAIARELYNDLEKVVLPAYPHVAELRETFTKFEILGTMMSGSGPSVFALTSTPETAEQVRAGVRRTITDPDLELWVAPLSSHGIHIAP